MSSLLLITCALPTCDRAFLVCSRCYRGHRYCSVACASIARTTSVREARKKYASSAKGAASQRKRSRRYYREKTRKKI